MVQVSGGCGAEGDQCSANAYAGGREERSEIRTADETAPSSPSGAWAKAIVRLAGLANPIPRPEVAHPASAVVSDRWPEKIENADENTLAEVIIQLMKDVGAPKGVRELGYSEDDIPALVDGAMKQQRLLVGSPKDVTEEDLANILRESIENW